MRFPNNDNMFVDVQSGNFFYRAVDCEIPSKGLNLAVKRYYNSSNSYDSSKNYSGWYFNFDEYLVIDPYDSSVIIKFPNGGMLRFEFDPLTNSYIPTTEDNYLSLERVIELNVCYYIITFPDDNKHFFNFEGDLIKERDPIGNEISYLREGGYHNVRNLTAIIDPFGRKIEVSYEEKKNNFDKMDGDGSNPPPPPPAPLRVMRITDWTGREFTYHFNHFLLVSYTDPAGRVTQYGYAYPGRHSENTFLLETISYPETGLFLYNIELGPSPNANKVQYQVFANGLVNEYHYDWNNGLRTITQGRLSPESPPQHPQMLDTRSHSYKFDSNWMLVSETDAAGNTFHYTRDSLGRVTAKIDPRGGMEMWSYNSWGRTETYTDKLGNTTAYEYHHLFKTKVTKITSPAPFLYETLFQYDDETGLLLSKTDPSGKTTHYSYYQEEDNGRKRGLLKEITDPLGNKTSCDYDNYGNLDSITDALGKTSHLTFDSLGRPIILTDPMGSQTHIRYDLSGNPVKTIDPLGNETLQEFDRLNRVRTISNALNNSYIFQYDSAGNTSRTIDPSGNKTDILFDVFSNPLKIIDPLERTIEFCYDSINRIVKYIDPMGRETTYHYDDYCGVKTEIDSAGIKSLVYSDLLCRPVKVQYQDEFFEFAYDQLGGKISATPDGIKYGDILYGSPRSYGANSYGGLKYAEEKSYYGYNPNDIIRFYYDQNRRIVSIKQKGDLTVDYEYDDAGRLVRTTDANGLQVVYSYLDNGLLEKSVLGSEETLHTYDDAGRLITTLYPNGVLREQFYDQASQLTQLRYTRSSKLLLQFDCQYDKTGNITGRVITRSDGIPEEYGYVYDQSGQLTQVLINGKTVSKYSYDSVGNRLLKEYIPQDSLWRGESAGFIKERYGYNADNEMQFAGFTVFRYDHKGNMISKTTPGEGKTQYLWNSSGRLLGVDLPSGESLRFRYRYDGLRYRKTLSGGDDSLFIWGLGSVSPMVSERDYRKGSGTGNAGSGANPDGAGANPVIASYPAGTNRIITPIGSGSSDGLSGFIKLTDHLGSVYALTDSQGRIAAQYRYDEFGIPVKTEVFTSRPLYNPLGYTGEPQHNDPAELIYLRQRYYAPQWGRFLSRDSLSRFPNYKYAANNPMVFVDPTGSSDENYNSSRNNILEFTEVMDDFSNTIIGFGTVGFYAAIRCTSAFLTWNKASKEYVKIKPYSCMSPNELIIALVNTWEYRMVQKYCFGFSPISSINIPL